jgi:hypothetical protein
MKPKNLYEIDLDPIDKKAALVTSDQKKMHYWANIKLNQQIFEFRPPTRKFCGPKKHDLTGKRQGRLYIEGIFIGQPKKQNRTKGGSIWVVRCDCGKYEFRRTRSLKNPNNAKDCCQYCRKIYEMKRSYDYHVLGIDN